MFDAKNMMCASDPRLGPPKDGQNQTNNQSFAPTGACVVQQKQGANCGK